MSGVWTMRRIGFAVLLISLGIVHSQKPKKIQPVLTFSPNRVLYNSRLTLDCNYADSATYMNIYVKKEGKNDVIASISDSSPAELSGDYSQSDIEVSGAIEEGSAQLSITYPYNGIGASTRFFCRVKAKEGKDPKPDSVKVTYKPTKSFAKPKVRTNPKTLVTRKSRKLEVNCDVGLKDIDATEVVTVPSQCPENWTPLELAEGGRLCYLPVDTQVTFDQAKVECQAQGQGAYLARPKTQEQADALSQLTGESWIGLRYDESTQQLKWQDGEDLSFNLWGEGQPDLSPSEEESQEESTDDNKDDNDDNNKDNSGGGGGNNKDDNSSKDLVGPIGRLINFWRTFFRAIFAPYLGQNGGPATGSVNTGNNNDVLKRRRRSADGQPAKQCVVHVGGVWETRGCQEVMKFVCELPAAEGATEARHVSEAIPDVVLTRVSISQRTNKEDNTYTLLASVDGSSVTTPDRAADLSTSAEVTSELSEDRTTLTLKVTWEEVPESPEYYYSCKAEYLDIKGDAQELEKYAKANVKK